MTTDPFEAAGLPVISWFDKPIRKAIEAVFDDLNKGTEALDLFRKYRRNHFRAVRSMVEHVQILGMSSPVPLKSLYAPVLVSTTIHGRLYQKDWHSAAQKSGPGAVLSPTSGAGLVRGDEFIEAHERVAVLGGPGSGKTTFLRHLALSYTEKEIFEGTRLRTSKLPFFVPAPAFVASGQTLFDYLTHRLRSVTDDYAPSFVRRVFRRGLAVLLVDSLDEVPLDHRNTVVGAIQEFCALFPKAKLVLSCRTADYEQTIEGFWEVEMARLTPAAVSQIVRAWFASDTRSAENLLRHLKADPGIASLTQTPLLLSLLCIQFRHDLALPKRKTELYRRCVDALLRDWDTSRGFRRNTAYAMLSDDRKERIFEHVAAAFYSPKPRYHFHESDLDKAVAQTCTRFNIDENEAHGIVKEIEKHHGIFERPSADSYAFSHPSFQDYFAARCFLAKRTDSEVVKAHYEDDDWSAVIEFIASLREDPTEILLFVRDQSKLENLKYYPAMARRTKHLWLLYRCLAAEPAILPETRDELLRHLRDSQIEIAGIYREGGVLPMAVLMEDGVKHAYFYYHKRQSLYEALQPLRKLANEVLLSPVERYSEVVLERLDELAGGAGGELARLSPVLCLLVPLASVNAKEVESRLVVLRQEAKDLAVAAWIDESLRVLRSRFLAKR